MDFPIRITRYEFIPNSGGGGTHRGGLGLLREYEMLAEEATMNIRGDRGKFAPQGNLGGGPGSCARYILNPGTENETILGSKTGGGRLRKGERLRVMAPGGGGYGQWEGRRVGERWGRSCKS